MDPPMAMTTAMAFSNAFRVRMSRGRMLLADGAGEDFGGGGRAVRLLGILRRHRGGVRETQAHALRSPRTSCWR